jgi:hypothetical protein|tara:strand:- start:9 stop:587 length:579 start_codon:yes stop_codon:yes gene_type:complete
MISSTLTGCLGLAFQRELMEEWREDPKVILKEETVGFDYTFESNSIESVYHTDEILIEFDNTISQLVINFRAQFPYSSVVEELVGNETNQYRYVDAKLWKPGVRESGGEPFWEVRATQDFPQQRFSFPQSDLISGNWIFEVEARGYGITAPIDQASFYDHFDTYVTITKPCVVFAESHDEGECTYLSDLQSE